MNITNLKIKNLNDIYNFDIPIVDNKLILVGENGTGKSTILSILNYILTRKWDLLSNIKFSSIIITIDNKDFNITRLELLGNNPITKNHRSSRSYSRKNELYFLLEDIIANENIDTSTLNDPITHDFIINKLLLETNKRYSPRSIKYLLLNYAEDFLHETSSHGNDIRILNNYINKNSNKNIIYLPTYRRIERELDAILPDYEFSHKQRNIYMPSSWGDLGKNSGECTIKSIHFGMSDVKNIINKELSELEESFRKGMKKLMGDYLQDILLDRHIDIDRNLLKDIDSNSLETVLLRIDNDTLSSTTKHTITENILKIGSFSNEKTNDSDKVIIYFIYKLMLFNEAQSVAEKKIFTFINVCNKYLVRKQISFNSLNFKVYIYNTNDNGEPLELKNTPSQIPFDSLSSGEKQIVSLFSHLYLSNTKEFMMIIDEPELSLSVAWQRTFLEDITASVNCTGLFAVTHSPFIFDNALDVYARSINEFMDLA